MDSSYCVHFDCVHSNRQTSKYFHFNTLFLSTGKEVQVIWKNLVDAYRKKTKSGNPGEPIDERAAQWRYFDRLSFLKNFIGGKKLVTIRFYNINRINFTITLSTNIHVCVLKLIIRVIVLPRCYVYIFLSYSNSLICCTKLIYLYMFQDCHECLQRFYVYVYLKLVFKLQYKTDVQVGHG